MALAPSDPISHSRPWLCEATIGNLWRPIRLIFYRTCEGVLPPAGPTSFGPRVWPHAHPNEDGFMAIELSNSKHDLAFNRLTHYISAASTAEVCFSKCSIPAEIRTLAHPQFP